MIFCKLCQHYNVPLCTCIFCILNHTTFIFFVNIDLVFSTMNQSGKEDEGQGLQVQQDVKHEQVQLEQVRPEFLVRDTFLFHIVHHLVWQGVGSISFCIFSCFMAGATTSYRNKMIIPRLINIFVLFNA